MKIAWFSPFTTNSAIGRYSKHITDFLAQKVEVDLWLDTKKNLLETKANKIYYQKNDSDICTRLKKYDCVVYNMGDNYLFHGNIYQIAKQYPGVVILHDYVMHHFFIEHYLEEKNPEEYKRIMSHFYGVEGTYFATEFLAGKAKLTWSSRVKKYPLYQPILLNQAGVISHSQWVIDHIAPDFSMPIKKLFLPYGNPQAKASKHNPDGKILILTIGHINENKCIDRIIRVLLSNPDIANAVNYVVIGDYDESCSYFRRLKEMVALNSLSDVVNFVGRQPDDVLYDYLNHADICINLRNPPMEAASYSVLEQMYFANPVIVINDGFYAELPSDTVIKVTPEHLEEQLTKSLKELILYKDLRQTYGKKARSYVEKNFTVESYVEMFLTFLEEVKDYYPVNSLLGKIKYRMAEMGVTSNMPIIDRVSQQLLDILKPIPENQ